jgi:hypothetical protein
MRSEFIPWCSASYTPLVALDSIHDYLKLFPLKDSEIWPELDMFKTATPFEFEVDVMPWISVDPTRQPFDVIAYGDRDKEADVAMEALSRIEMRKDKVVFSLTQIANIHLQNEPDVNLLASAGVRMTLVPELVSE